MTGAFRLLGQFVTILALFAAVAVLADWPRLRNLPENSGVVLLSFVYGADRHADCRRLTAEEIARLPANMRKAEDCPRRRRPLYVELDLDDRPIFRAALPPTGIAGDGPSRVYRRFVVPAGEHDVKVRMRDTARAEGFDHRGERRVAIAPEQLLVVDFRADAKEFVFR